MRNQKIPHYTLSPTGDTILDLLEERGWTTQDLADRMGTCHGYVQDIVEGKECITEQDAERLAEVLGSTKGFWLRLDEKYWEKYWEAKNRIDKRDKTIRAVCFFVMLASLASAMFLILK